MLHFQKVSVLWLNLGQKSPNTISMFFKLNFSEMDAVIGARKCLISCLSDNRYLSLFGGKGSLITIIFISKKSLFFIMIRLYFRKIVILTNDTILSL